VSSSRPFPYAGMPVRVMHLGVTEVAAVEEVRDDGRTLLVGGEAYTLRRLNGWFVRDGEPYYGTRLLLAGDPEAPDAAPAP
jgi:hypothetical protein